MIEETPNNIEITRRKKGWLLYETCGDSKGSFRIRCVDIELASPLKT